MKDRDARDSGRAASPMVPAADATVIDSTALDADAAFAAAVAWSTRVVARRRSPARPALPAEWLAHPSWRPGFPAGVARRRELTPGFDDRPPETTGWPEKYEKGTVF